MFSNTTLHRSRKLAVLGASLAIAAVAGGGVAAAGSGTAPSGSDKVAPTATTQTTGVILRVMSPTVTVPPFGFKGATAICPIGTELTGGGGTNNSQTGAVVLTDSMPVTDRRWDVFVKNNGATAQTVNAFVLCTI